MSISSQLVRLMRSALKEYDLTKPDEKQWDAMEKGHLLFLILDSQRANPLFRSPISSKAQNIIDLGTGQGDW